ncbi:helix-turn-helix domain-containing protein [Chitinophaga sp.]|uniref:helix-turn-helix domain-containing protein n=1 Tax=Chitinophaga sp. TaxID=1869181 RepID=UPI0031D5C8C1
MPIPGKILSRKDEITAEFMRLVDEHVNDLLTGRTDYRYKPSDFASRMHIAAVHLTNTIKLTLNTSPCEIMEDRIVQEAKKMLDETTLGVADIGNLLGFPEPTNFNRFFKNMTGITPLQHRRNKILKY